MQDGLTPGVYITEMDAFGPPVFAAPTAVPAFIGYTEKATLMGRLAYNRPIRIESFDQYVAIFGEGFAGQPEIIGVDASRVAADPDVFDVSLVDKAGTTHYYAINQTGIRSFALHASVKLFYDNGGGVCYINSIGNYTDDGASEAGVAIDVPDQSRCISRPTENFGVGP